MWKTFYGYSLILAYKLKFLHIYHEAFGVSVAACDVWYLHDESERLREWRLQYLELPEDLLQDLRL